MTLRDAARSGAGRTRGRRREPGAHPRAEPPAQGRKLGDDAASPGYVFRERGVGCRMPDPGEERTPLRRPGTPPMRAPPRSSRNPMPPRSGRRGGHGSRPRAGCPRTLAPRAGRVSGKARNRPGTVREARSSGPSPMRRLAAACEPLPPCAGDLVAEPRQTFAVSPPTIVCAVAPYRPSETVMLRLDRQVPVTLAAVVYPGHTRCPAGARVFAMPLFLQKRQSGAATARANRRNSLILLRIRTIRRGICHHAATGPIQTQDHDRPSMSSSSNFVASPRPTLHRKPEAAQRVP